MKQVFKFRGKRFADHIIPGTSTNIPKGTWVYSDGLVKDYFNDNVYVTQVGDPIISHVDIIRVVPETVCMYLGISDMKGVEAYDGDIYINNQNGNVGVLSVDAYTGGYHVRCKEYNSEGRLVTIAPFGWLDLTDFDIIGDIFDNKELIPQ